MAVGAATIRDDLLQSAAEYPYLFLVGWLAVRRAAQRSARHARMPEVIRRCGFPPRPFTARGCTGGGEKRA
jgi:hypothetical protein